MIRLQHGLDVPIAPIEYVEANGNCSNYHLIDGRVILTSLTIAARQPQLGARFVRIHKGYLVNTDHLRVIPDSSVVFTRSGRKLPVARRVLQRLRQPKPVSLLECITKNRIL